MVYSHYLIAYTTLIILLPRTFIHCGDLSDRLWKAGLLLKNERKNERKYTAVYHAKQGLFIVEWLVESETLMIIKTK